LFIRTDDLFPEPPHFGFRPGHNYSIRYITRHVNSPLVKHFADTDCRKKRVSGHPIPSVGRKEEPGCLRNDLQHPSLGLVETVRFHGGRRRRHQNSPTPLNTAREPFDISANAPRRTASPSTTSQEWPAPGSHRR